MIHHATIAKLAEAITAEDQETAWSVLVPIQPEGQRPPLFCVHGITGDVLWFNELGRCMAPNQPLYGLQASGLAPGERYATTIEQMAAGYIEAMRSVQPQGPYFVAGASFGGIVVLEIARQLEAAGEQVGLAAILDFDPYQSGARTQGRFRSIVNYIRYLPRRLSGELNTMSPSQRRVWARWRLRCRLKRTVSLLLGGAKLPPDADDDIPYGAELPTHRRELLIANSVAFERYVPRPFGGRITLFATESQYTFEAATTNKSGWSQFAEDGVAIVHVPGSHESMFKQPHVVELAHQLRRLIGEVIDPDAEA
jgi:thioesterase domain-containing protein